jgi:putative aldouronate transport system permease protein
MIRTSKLYRRIEVFDIFNFLILTGVSLLCILPFFHIVAVSLSDSGPASQYIVGLWPVDFTTIAYEIVFKKPDFWSSLSISIQRLLLGVTINMLLTIAMAYPLSKETRVFPSRNIYVWIVVFTMLFNGGLIPTYMVIKSLGLIDSIWALVLPSAVPVFNVILMVNFMRQLPKELEEASVIDGATQWDYMIRVAIPLSVPVIATITLFSAVHHWNSWFDGLMYINDPQKYPLQTYLRGVLASLNSVDVIEQRQLELSTDRTVVAAQIFVSALPILICYPLLQRYFIHGIVMGSVKE